MRQRVNGRRFPDLQATEQEIKEYHKRHFSQYSAYRSRHLQRITEALYYEIGRQWIQLDKEALYEGVRGYAYADQVDEAGTQLPRPVTNMIAPAIDVEFATLSKRQWVPKIPSYYRDPRLSAAAKVAEDVLNDKLEKLGWEDLRDRFILNLAKMGTSIFYSYWDTPYTDVVWTAAENPHGCPQCGMKFASSTMPAPFRMVLNNGGMPSVEELNPDDDEEVPIGKCPKCECDIVPIELSEEESQDLDAFKRPMGEHLPRGKTALELVTPYEYYPENAGVGVTPETARIHGIDKIRSLDWIEERHPELIDEIWPEEPSELMRTHPLMGEWDIVGRFNGGLDGGIYDHHAHVYDIIAEPSYRFPKGRFIRLIGSTQLKIATNTDLIREVDTEDGKAKVAIAMVTAAVWKPREGEFWGKTLADDIKSPQNRLNGIDAQVIEARDRMGSPNIMTPDDANLTGPEFLTNYGSGKVFKYQLSPLNPQAKPEVFGGQTMPAGVYNERDRCEQAITKIIGPADIEIGEAPRNITTTSGLQILGEQAERRRATRERGITTSFRKVWEHQLSMIWVLQVDVDTYEAELPDGSWEIKEFKGQMLAGQTKIKIERQAYIEKSIIIREATVEAMNLRLYDISTPVAKRKVLEQMGLPTDVNEDTSLQIEHAKRQWVNFVDRGVIPVVDLGIDNPYIRKEVIGGFLMQDEGQNIANAAMWPKILPMIAGWEQQLEMLTVQDAMARQFYGGEPEPAAAAEMYAKAMMAHQQSRQQYDQDKTLLPAGTPPPEEPPPPTFIPLQPEHRIFLVWMQMINNKGGLEQLVLNEAVANMEDPKELLQKVQSFLRFRAVFEAYRVNAPMAPAPGSMPGENPGDAALPTTQPPAAPQGA